MTENNISGLNSESFMLLSFCFTDHVVKGKKTPHLLCSLYVRVFMGGTRLNGVT